MTGRRPGPRHRGLGVLLVTLACLGAVPAGAWDASRLSVPLVIDRHTVPFPEFAIYVMPGQTFRVSLGESAGEGLLRFGGQIVSGGALTAPDAPGVTRLEVTNPSSRETAVVHVFTMIPAAGVDDRGFLNGYRIGDYPRQPLRGLDIYRRPAGFVEVTAANADTPISPNFRLGQFVCKQDQGYPKYVVLRAGLLLKLENILAALNHRGYATRELTIMSGYRTPWYNHAIGNVPYSRHLWGGAADIYIDQAPADGRMDDLDGDGKVDRNDARWLADFVNRMSQEGRFGPRVGGLGIYGSSTAHGPFVHVDVRGTRARW